MHDEPEDSGWQNESVANLAFASSTRLFHYMPCNVVIITTIIISLFAASGHGLRESKHCGCECNLAE